MTEFLETLIAPVVGDVGVKLVRYLARKADDVDRTWIYCSWSELADVVQVKGPGRARRVRAACDTLSSMRIVFNHRRDGFNAWLIGYSDMPCALYVTVGDGLTSEFLMRLEQIHPDYRKRLEVQVHRTVVVTG